MINAQTPMMIGVQLRVGSGSGSGSGGGGGGGRTTSGSGGAGRNSLPQRMQIVFANGFGSVHTGQSIDAPTARPAVPGSRRKLSPLPSTADPLPNSVDLAQKSG